MEEMCRNMKLAYTFKNDVLFKKLFVDYPELLKMLVSVMLNISFGSIKEFTITNPEIPPEIIGEKFCRIDINMIVNGMHVNLEIQVHDEGDFEKRLMFYWGREYTSALQEGGHYIDLPQTVIISIVAFKMLECEEYYSRFQTLEVTRHERLTEVLDIHICELCKLPDVINAEDKRELWLQLFDAKTEEDLKKIEMLGCLK
jgi:predicted transposase/invertase (TIGR01784 family)